MQILLTSDMHLREDTPLCRVDNFQEHQSKIFTQVLRLSKECDLWLDAGDVFHKARPSLKFVNDIFSLMKKHRAVMYVAAGNHDLPAHAINRLDESGLGMLVTGRVARTHSQKLFEEHGVKLIPYGDCQTRNMKNVDIVVIHKMVYPNQQSIIPNVAGAVRFAIFNGFPRVKLCVSGHNHTPFTAKNRRGQVLVNPGGITVQTADKQTQVPCVYIYDTVLHKVETIELEHDPTTVSREHIEEKEYVEERVASFRIFIQGLIETDEATLSFRNMVEQALTNGKVQTNVTEKVHEALEGE